MKILKAKFVKSCARLEDCPTDGLPEIAFAGRSNVGKSSLLNKLLHQKGLAKISRTPGKTRLINYFEVLLAPIPREPFYMVDLPGYGYAKASADQQASWGKLVEHYLRGRPELREVIVLLDIRREPSALDQQLLSWTEHYRLPISMVVTKLDKVSRGGRPAALRSIQNRFPPFASDLEVLPVSSLTGEGCDTLLQKIVHTLAGGSSEGP